MLTCQEMTQLVTDYLEGQMDEDERLRFQKHLGLCRDCRSHVGKMRGMVDTLGKLPEEPIPDDVMGVLLERFRDWKS